MEFKQLRSFAAVVRCGSFTKASEQLYLSQPTVSAHIQALEEELGTCLLLRTTKSLEITPMGQEVYQRAVDILELQRQMMELGAGSARKTIRLGASTIPSAYILPQLLPEFKQRRSEILFTVQQSNSQGVSDGLVDGLFDVGLMGMKAEGGRLTCVPFCRDSLILITPPREPFLSLQRRPEPPLEELLRHPIILRERSSGSQKSAGRFLDSLGVSEEQLHVTARINDQEAIKNLVAGGLGVSLISERAARNFVEEKRVLQFDLPGHNVRSLYLAYRRDYILQSHVKEFFTFVRRKFSSEPGYEIQSKTLRSVADS